MIESLYGKSRIALALLVAFQLGARGEINREILTARHCEERSKLCKGQSSTLNVLGRIPPHT
jgi:hypothetical protein